MSPCLRRRTTSRQAPIATPDLPTKRGLQASNTQSTRILVENTVSDNDPINPDGRIGRLLLDAQERDVRQGQIEAVVRALDRDVQIADAAGNEGDGLCGVGAHGLAVVEIQRAEGAAVDARRDNQRPGALAGISGRQRHGLRGQDGAAADVDGDVAERRVDGRVLGGGHGDGRLVVPVVVHVRPLDQARKHAVDARGALREHGGDEDRGAQEELAVRGGERRVVRELPGEGAHDGVAARVRIVEQRVQVRQQLEADGHGGLCGVDDAGPDVRLLWIRRQGVVVAVEGEERRQLHPPVAQLFGRLPVEAARVDPDQRDPEQREAQRLRDRKVHVVELGRVVPAPVARHRARARERRAPDHERSLVWHCGRQRRVCRLQDLMPVQVVDVVLEDPVDVRRVRGDCVHGQIALDVVDHVGRVVDVPDPRCGCCAEVAG